MCERLSNDEIEAAFDALDSGAQNTLDASSPSLVRRPANYSEALDQLLRLRRELQAAKARERAEKSRRRAAEKTLTRHLGGL